MSGVVCKISQFNKRGHSHRDAQSVGRRDSPGNGGPQGLWLLQCPRSNSVTKVLSCNEGVNGDVSTCMAWVRDSWLQPCPYLTVGSGIPCCSLWQKFHMMETVTLAIRTANIYIQLLCAMLWSKYFIFPSTTSSIKIKCKHG